MITPPKDCNQHLASAWTAGIAALFLGIGLSGAGTPLLPDPLAVPVEIQIGDSVMAEEFEPPPPAAEEETVAEPAEVVPEEEMEIPPIPEITPPLTPPEMADLAPLDPIIDKPKPPPAVKPPVNKPKPVTRPPAPAGNPNAKPGPVTTPAGKPGGTGQPSASKGGGKGRFPQPGYPPSARRAGLQGSVKLSVTVETSGLPGSVSVVSSSGHAILDAAARDQVQRRWRWPAGEVRRFVVPVRFVLQ